MSNNKIINEIDRISIKIINFIKNKNCILNTMSDHEGNFMLELNLISILIRSH